MHFLVRLTLKKLVIHSAVKLGEVQITWLNLIEGRSLGWGRLSLQSTRLSLQSTRLRSGELVKHLAVVG